MTKMATLNATTYGAVFGRLIKEPRLMPLGPGTPNPDVQSELKNLTIEKSFGSETVGDEDMARCCLAGLWLYHDYLDESHSLSQKIESPTGSYWHGLMHRREPDYANSKYWFRHFGTHPIFESLAAAAKGIAAGDVPGPAQFLRSQSAWDPFAFIDLCEKAAGSSAEMLCRLVQQREWELLFDFCYRSAIGIK
jgi:hypothetical protein